MKHIEQTWNNKEELKKINESCQNKDEINSCLYFSKFLCLFPKN